MDLKFWIAIIFEAMDTCEGKIQVLLQFQQVPYVVLDTDYMGFVVKINKPVALRFVHFAFACYISVTMKIWNKYKGKIRTLTKWCSMFTKLNLLIKQASCSILEAVYYLMFEEYL